MTFEGKQINIPIKGIIRAGTDNLCVDGAMNEVIGMEYKDGSFLPYEPDESSLVIYVKNTRNLWVPIDDIKKSWVHKSSDGKSRRIFIRENNDVLYEKFVDEDQSLYTEKLASNVNSLSIVGNLICLSTNNGLLYYIWDLSSEKYKSYSAGDILAQLPSVNFKVSSFDPNKQQEGSVNSGQILYARSDFFATEFYNTLVYAGAGALNTTSIKERFASIARKAQYSVQENGRLYGSVLVCCAYRLKNGSYISASSPLLMNYPCIKNGEGDTEHKVYIPSSALSGSPSARVFKKSVNSDDIWADEFSFMYDEDDLSANGIHVQDAINETGSEINSFTSLPSLFGYYHDMHRHTTLGSGFAVVGCLSNLLYYKIKSDIPDELKLLVDSLCIFVSEQVNPYVDFASKSTEFLGGIQLSSEADYTGGFRFNMRSDEEIYNDIIKLKNLYKVAEIPFNSIAESDDWKIVDMKGKLGDALLTQESLPISAFIRTDIVSGSLDVYNLRLHVYGYKQKLFEGYDMHIADYTPGVGQLRYGEEFAEEEEEVYIKVLIDSQDGHSEVWKTMNTHPRLLNPVISYPDSNATSIEFYTCSENTWYKKAYNLIPSNNGAFAFCVESDFDCTDPWGTGREEVAQPTIKNINDIFEYKNRLKVSDSTFASYFPVENTYTIGNREIIGIATLAISLSQDTFGKFPMLVFCSDGIYSLGVNESGSGAYTTVTPFSREVCVNINTICEIDGAVVFASDKGLMLASQRGVEEFSPALNGSIRFSPDESAENIKSGRSIYNKIITETRIIKLKNSLSTEDFIKYLHDSNGYTTVSYVSKKNKLIIYNKSKEYVYLIDISTRNATKISKQIYFDDDNYPTEIYWNKIEVNGIPTYKNESFEYESIDSNIDCLIQSRPIKIQQDDKCSFRVVITGYFEGPNDNNKWAALVTLGSLDGKHWRTIGLKEKKLNGGFHNLGCVTERESWKYIMFIFAGQLSNNSHIDSIDITAEGRYNNKKR